MLCSNCHEKPPAARGVCKSCYDKLRRDGLMKKKNVQNIGLCSIDSCSKPAWAKGMCPHHYEKAQHPMYHSWRLLRSRYSGEYPEAWNRFDTFMSEVGERPTSDSQLRRIDDSLPYSISNIRWTVPVGKNKTSLSTEEQRTYGKEWNLQRKFGITGEQYAGLLAAQNGVCSVCEEKETHVSKNGHTKELAVDHDHETGSIRGLLCFNCNQAIGRMQDDPDRLEAAAAYLRRHSRYTCEEIIG